MKQENQIKGIITLAGLSESGKSTLGLYFESMGILRQKIIEIEKEMMIKRNMDISNGLTDELFIELYSENINEVFEEFVEILLRKMVEKNKMIVSLESLYRAELAIFLKNKFKDLNINIYIDAPLEVRVSREYQKVKDKYSLEEVRQQTLIKDEFKIKHNALKVKDIADLILINDDRQTKKSFEQQAINYLEQKLGKWIQ